MKYKLVYSYASRVSCACVKLWLTKDDHSSNVYYRHEIEKLQKKLKFTKKKKKEKKLKNNVKLVKTT